MFKMNSINKKISQQDIKSFEVKYSLCLPKEYIAFLLEFNGGYPKKSNFEISEDQGISLVNKFYGIGEETGDLGETFEILDGELPDGFISIADDPAGNEICIGVEKNDYEGQVYFWIHDMENESDMDNMFLLAENFNAFLENLY
ncbi:SMI1/KNR4 family protein [Listeria booriae]|uniref:SMI1/KNR4 family protein n=1 Tax=Listeria booriae TaxID=1552123 RepID=UPI00162A0282|nr:SMI1/KNR4 family protein [Listeria booriae]MBC2368388.1 SMI1/KNR4 family protein [Listeria booriae]